MSSTLTPKYYIYIYTIYYYLLITIKYKTFINITVDFNISRKSRAMIS